MLFVADFTISMSSLPEGFVYLDQVDPTIVQKVIYYGEQNFLGHQLSGYKAPKIILTEQAAFRLKNIQKDIKKDNYSLVIYDGYRPSKALFDFIKWRDLPDRSNEKKFYHPYLTKQQVFEHRYCTPTSGHSRGSTVDLTLIELGKTVDPNPKAIGRQLRDGRWIYRLDDNTVDMFTSVDLMDPASWGNSTLFDDIYQQRRNYLHSKMMKYGFYQYELEWWHFTLTDEPFKTIFFDFDIE